MGNRTFTDEVLLALSMNYTNKSIEGISGVLAGKNCTIDSATKSDGVTTIVFKWTADNGDVRTTTIEVADGDDGLDGKYVVDAEINTTNNHLILTLSDSTTIDCGEVPTVAGKDGADGKDGKDGTNGQDGADGFSPTIVVKASTDSTYILTITDKNGSYDTPNLKGSGGGGSSLVNIIDSPTIGNVGGTVENSTQTITHYQTDTNVIPNVASGDFAHAEGVSLEVIDPSDDSVLATMQGTASGFASHSEGLGTKARAPYSSTSGMYSETTVGAIASHVEGGVFNKYDSPVELGLFEKAGNQGYVYIPTDDTEFEDKTYAYITPVDSTVPVSIKQALNPREDFLLEKVSGEDKYEPSSDTVFDNNKTYYIVSWAQPPSATVYSNTLTHKVTQNFAHAEGFNNYASGLASHVEGAYNYVWGSEAHAEGAYNKVFGEASHAEGINNSAIGFTSHTEGSGTQAIGTYSHAEGYSTVAIGKYSHAEGLECQANANFSHAGGYKTIANAPMQTVIGKYNVSQGTPSGSGDSTDYAFIIGNGVNTENRANAFGVRFNGKITYANGKEFTPAELTSMIYVSSTKPSPSEYLLGKTLLYIGASTSFETQAFHVYRCVAGSSAGSYVWEDITPSLQEPQIDVSGTPTSYTIYPNTLYRFGELTSLTITLGAGDSFIVKNYHFTFESGSTPTVLTLPNGVKTPSGYAIPANSIVEISIVNNLLSYQTWDNS